MRHRFGRLSRFFACFAVALIAAVLMSRSVLAQQADWPQWRGPNRDGHAADQKLLLSWPPGGPKLKWQFDHAGEGFSSLAVVGDRLFTMGADEEDCFVICLDAKSGKLVWKTTIDRASKRRDYNQTWGEGPRATPTVDGDQLFVLSDLGVLAAIDKSTGEVQWSVDLPQQYQTNIPKWGFSESPLVDDDRVVVTPGGPKYLVAFDRRSGQEVWSSKGIDQPAHYSSLVKGTLPVDGTLAAAKKETSQLNSGAIPEPKRFYVAAGESGLIGVDAESGQRLFSDTSTASDVAVISTPLLKNDHLYHTTAYGVGNTLLKLSIKDDTLAATQRYHRTGKTMLNHHGGVVEVDGVIYGFTKVDGGRWMAQDLESGDLLWIERVGRNRSGSVCYASGRLYCYNDIDGTCYLVQPSGDQWRPTGKLTLPRQTQLDRDKGGIWAHPVIANQTLFIRDLDLIFAYDIAQR